jgi:hypothetical protein
VSCGGDRTGCNGRGGETAECGEWRADGVFLLFSLVSGEAMISAEARKGKRVKEERLRLWK